MSFLSSKTSKQIVREGALDAVKIGAAETYFGAFGVFLGGTPFQIGALATLPPLIGAMSQALGMRISEKIPSRRDVIVRIIQVQAALCTLFGSVSFLFESRSTALWVLIALVSLYHITIGLIAPLWNSLIGDIVPPISRGEFFGYRNKWISIVTFAGVVAAGECIHLSAIGGYEVYGYAAIFVIAGLSRLWSAKLFGGVSDPTLHVPEGSKFSFWQFVIRARHSNFVKFVIFISSMNFAAALSGPYLAMYMLNDLKFSYHQYTIVVAAVVLMQFLVMRSWGILSDQFGNRQILKVCGVLVSINPILWAMSSELWFIIALQLYSGMFWAGFNLAAANFVFDVATPAKRARCFAYQSIISGTCVFLGSALGGWLVVNQPQSLAGMLAMFVNPSAFLALFFLSAILRVVSMVFLFPLFEEVREVKRVRGYQILVRVVSLRPLWGATFGVISERKKRR